MARYHEIANELETRIRAGRYHHQLPGVGALAGEFNVAINTVRAAEKELEQRGLVRIAQGEGVFLVDAPDQDPHEQALAEIAAARAALDRAEQAIRRAQ